MSAAGARPLVAPGWTAALIGLGLGLLAIGIAFRPEITAAVATWDSSTAYSHCWLVLPLAAWLGWVRRDRLVGLAPEPLPAVALLGLVGAATWLVMERLGIMEGRQFAALGFVWLLALSVLGWRVCRAMAAPLAYLAFLVPFGEFATPWLQEVTLWIIVAGLRVLGISHHVDGLVIEIPEGVFLVAEACAGLRFLIAALAFGAIYALEMFRSPGRRLIVMALAVAVPVLANGLRALGIVLLGHHLGSAEAAATDHLVYGWVFFCAVILLMILAGLPFRQDGMARPAPSPRAAAVTGRTHDRLRALLAGALAGGLALGGPVSAVALAASALPPRLLPAMLAAPQGCEPAGEALRCGPWRATASITVFSPHANWAQVAAARRRALGLGDDEAVIIDVATAGAAWQARQPRGELAMAGAGVWLDGRPMGDGLRARIVAARQSVAGSAAPVLVTVTLAPVAEAAASPREALRWMELILRAQESGVVRDAVAASMANASR